MNSLATPSEALNKPPGQASRLRQVLRYLLHLSAVYVIVNTTTMWLAGRVHDWVLPLLHQRSPSESYLQFAFTHLFVFSLFPAAVVAFAYAQWYPHRVALFVWIIPLLLLVYKFITFPSSAFESHSAAAFHEYFADKFLIPEVHSYRELFEVVSSGDAQRGMQQFRFTAPFYAAVGYSIGAWIGIHRVIPKFTNNWRRLRAFRSTTGSDSSPH